MKQVQEGKANRFGQTYGRDVTQGHNPDLLVWDEIHAGSGAQKESTAVTELELTLWVGIYVPAQAVKLALGTFARGNGRRNRAAHLRLVGFGQCRSRQDLPAIHIPVAELKPYPLRQISYTGAHATCGCFCIGVAYKAILVDAIFEYVQRRFVRVVLVVGKARTCGSHADFRVEAFVSNLLPWFADLFRGGNGSFCHSKIAVVVGGAELTHKRHETQTGEYFRARVAEVFENIACAGGKGALMREHVPDRYLPSRRCVGERKARVQPHDSVIPANVPRTYERSEDRRRNRLGQRCDLKDGVGVDWSRLINLAHAVAFQENNFILIHNRHRQARHFGLRHGLANIGIHSCQSRLDIRRRRYRICPRRNGRRTEQDEKNTDDEETHNRFSAGE